MEHVLSSSDVIRAVKRGPTVGRNQQVVVVFLVMQSAALRKFSWLIADRKKVFVSISPLDSMHLWVLRIWHCASCIRGNIVAQKNAIATQQGDNWRADEISFRPLSIRTGENCSRRKSLGASKYAKVSAKTASREKRGRLKAAQHSLSGARLSLGILLRRRSW